MLCLKFAQFRICSVCGEAHILSHGEYCERHFQMWCSGCKLKVYAIEGRIFSYCYKIWLASMFAMSVQLYLILG